MAKRDPDKTARNRIIANIKAELRSLLPKVLEQTGADNEQSLNARIGSKSDEFFDLKHDVIRSHDEFVNRWLQGLKNAVETCDSAAYDWLWRKLRKSRAFKRYLLLFLKRSYLKHFEELSKQRPRVEESEIWIGQRNADYGLLVTPRFSHGQWGNDKSEIRAFKQGYWTIGHVMTTGLVIPGKKRQFTFSAVDQYLMFFRDSLVRASGSQYQYEIADYYCVYVKNHPSPLDVPLLIPEFRYRGKEKKHVYRLDFLVINPFTLDKVGFELSPWSTHGYLRQIKKLTQKEVNAMARDNFENEMKRHRDYFKRHNIFALIYTDRQLADCEQLFDNEIKPLLEPERPTNPVSFQIMEQFLWKKRG